MNDTDLRAAFDEHRDQLLRYLRAHGAGDYADDLMHELWLKVAARRNPVIVSPSNYLFRAATNLMIDLRRSEARARVRDREWSQLTDRTAGSIDPDPGSERSLVRRQNLLLVQRELSKLPARVLTIFRAHRIEGRTQREIAEEMRLSRSLIEKDLRRAYRLLAEIKLRMEN